SICAVCCAINVRSSISTALGRCVAGWTPPGAMTGAATVGAATVFLLPTGRPRFGVAGDAGDTGAWFAGAATAERTGFLSLIAILGLSLFRGIFEAMISAIIRRNQSIRDAPASRGDRPSRRIIPD